MSLQSDEDAVLNLLNTKLPKEVRETMTIAEKIRTKGRAEGRVEGLTEGEARGITKGRAEIIYKLRRSGMPVASIAEIVELSIDEVKQLLGQK